MTESTVERDTTSATARVTPRPSPPSTFEGRHRASRSHDRLDRLLTVRCVGGLLLRDISVLRHNLSEFAMRTLVQPAMFIFVFAYLFPHIGQGIGGSGGTGFANILIPGLIAVSAVFCGVSSVSLPLAIEFGATREIEDRVMAPVPLWAVGAEKILFGGMQSAVSAMLVLPLGLLLSAQTFTVSFTQPALLVAVVLLACWISGALGLAIGTVVAPQRMGLVFSALVVPLTFLGCVYYPWIALSAVPWLKVVVLANPLVYMSEGLRAALVPEIPHMSAWAYLGGGALFALTLTVVSLRMFARRVTNL